MNKIIEEQGRHPNYPLCVCVAVSYVVQTHVFLYNRLDLLTSTFTQDCVDCYWAREVAWIKTQMDQAVNPCLHCPLGRG